MNVLIVEDDDDARDLLRDVLDCLGHVPVLASNGLEGMERLVATDVDVVLSDIDMPTMSGIAFHEAARSIPQFEKIPWIFLTSYPTLSKYAPRITPEYDMILQKPCSLEKLLEIFGGVRSHL